MVILAAIFNAIEMKRANPLDRSKNLIERLALENWTRITFAAKHGSQSKITNERLQISRRASKLGSAIILPTFFAQRHTPGTTSMKMPLPIIAAH